MRIVCPICAAAYDVPQVLLAPAGRLVRCARCGEEWSPGPGSGSPAPAAHAEPSREHPTGLPPEPPGAEIALAVTAPLAASRHARPIDDGRARRFALAGWIATLMVLGAAGWGAYAWRADIQRAWPASQRAYAALGLA